MNKKRRMILKTLIFFNKTRIVKINLGPIEIKIGFTIIALMELLNKILFAIIAGLGVALIIYS